MPKRGICKIHGTKLHLIDGALRCYRCSKEETGKQLQKKDLDPVIRGCWEIALKYLNAKIAMEEKEKEV